VETITSATGGSLCGVVFHGWFGAEGALGVRRCGPYMLYELRSGSSLAGFGVFLSSG